MGLLQLPLTTRLMVADLFNLSFLVKHGLKIRGNARVASRAYMPR
jgi:hypothetical protein